MSEDIKQAAQAVNEIKGAFEAFKETNDARLKEIEAKGAADPLIDEKLARIDAALEAAQKTADDAFLAVKRSQRITLDNSGVDLEAKAAEWAAQVSKHTQRIAPDSFTAEDMASYKSAFFGRGGFARTQGDGRSLGADSLKALSVGSDPDGGYFVPVDTSGRIVQKIYETSPIRAFASTASTSRMEYEGFYDNDEAGAEWEGENVSGGETSTPQFGKYLIPVREIRARPHASQNMLEDADFNVESWLAEKVAMRFARKENTAFVVGDGVATPRGFLSYPNSTDLTVGIEQVKTGVNGAFAAAPNGGDVLITALHKLKPAYMANATWFMDREARATVRKLKDSDGAYLWAQSLASGMPSTLLGYPVAIFEDMPTIETGSLSIAVGDMRAAYQIVDRIGISTLRDPFTVKPAVEFFTRKRTGGALINGEALKLIHFAS